METRYAVAAGMNGEAYRLLQRRLRTLLPEKYRETYEDVQPVLMGSAGLKYGDDGRVAWDAIWQTFCDLAMAGGPPHRGTLLIPATRAEIKLEAKQYRQVVAELCRGVEMVTGLAAEPARVSGWIAVDCPSRGMAGWLVRAINMENVSAHCEGLVLHLPAGPRFRVEKEIKNVVVAIAKTCHYWVGHTSLVQRRAIGELLQAMEGESPLLQMPFSARDAGAGDARLRAKIAEDIAEGTGLQPAMVQYRGWVGIDCVTVQAAVWMMRVLIAGNTLARREDTGLYLPLNAAMDGDGKRAAALVTRAYEMACAQGAMSGTAQGTP